MSRDTRYTTELDNTDVLRRNQFARNSPNPTGPEGSGPFMYALYIFDIQTGKTLRQFGFDVSPKSIREDEPFAEDVVAAQEGGWWVDGRGQYFKDVTVAGDFGLRPSPKRFINGGGSSLNRAGRAISQSANQVAISGARLANVIAGSQAAPQGEFTGPDRFRMLKNLFRWYADLKRKRDTASRVMMVWANYKNGEVYLCVPKRFGEERTVPSGRFKSNYNFQLKLLAPLRVEVPKDWLFSPRSQQGRGAWLDKLKQVANVLDASRQLIETTANSIAEFGIEIADSILRPVASAVELARGIVDGAATLARFPLEAMRAAHRTCMSVIGTIAETAENARKFERIGMEYQRMARAIAASFVPLKIFSRQDSNAPAQAYARKYRERSGIPPFDSGARTNRQTADTDSSGFVLGGSNIPQGEKKIKIPKSLTIRGIAQQFLGQAGRWKEIAILNNLKPPYLSPSGDGKNVLRPGQIIRIPAVIQDGQGQIFDTRDDAVEKEGYDFGRDLKIDLNTFSFLVDDTGDLAVVEGEENLTQAVNIKIRTKPGDLVVHPWFGFSGEVGSALTLDLLARYHLELKMTLLSDTRIERIKSLSLQASGDILSIRGSLEAKGKDDAVGLSVFLPSGV